MARISIEKLNPSPEELRARLGTPSDIEFKCLSGLDFALRSDICPSYIISRVPISVSDDGMMLGDVAFMSDAFGRILGTASEVYILVATLGYSPDRRIAQAMAESTSTGFITDALADCYIEALVDYVCDKVIPDMLEGGESVGHRFSPGYADLPLSLNRDIIRLTGASARLGIRLTDSGLMTPKKSVTALIPIYKE